MASFGNILFGIITIILMIAYCLQITIGVANKHTLNDNTSGVATLLLMMETLPIELYENIAFVFFDMEEVGLVGSKNFMKTMPKSINEKPIVNFDCVANGDTFIFVEKKMFRVSIHAKALRGASKTSIKPAIHREALKYPYMSDQLNFKNSVGTVAAKKNSCIGILHKSYSYIARYYIRV